MPTRKTPAEHIAALEQRLRDAEQERDNLFKQAMELITERDAAEQKLKQAAETYVVALDVSEQTWRKEVEAAEQERKVWRDWQKLVDQAVADGVKARQDWQAAEQRAERYKAALANQGKRLVRLAAEVDAEHDAAYAVERLGDLIHNAIVANDAALAEPQET